MHLITFLPALFASLVYASSRQHSRQAVIVDTDLFGDVDDVGALTIVNVLHNCGLADLRGIAINTHAKYGAPAASVRADLVLTCNGSFSHIAARLSAHTLAMSMYQSALFGH